MKRCEISGKGMMFGHAVSHSHRLNKRVWKPNLQTIKILVNGSPLKVKVSSKMLKTLKGASELETLKILKDNEKTLSPRITKALAKTK